MFKTRKVRSDLVPPGRTYTSTDVARIAQVSLRQLQWWDERKVVSPHHEGHKRIYLAEEVIEITLIAELRRKGFFRSRRFAACCVFCSARWAVAWQTCFRMIPNFTC